MRACEKPPPPWPTFNSFTAILSLQKKRLTFTEHVTINHGYPQDKCDFPPTLGGNLSTFLLQMQTMNRCLHLPMTATEHCDNLLEK